jgi:hypothetical protein
MSSLRVSALAAFTAARQRPKRAAMILENAIADPFEPRGAQSGKET